MIDEYIIQMVRMRLENWQVQSPGGVDLELSEDMVDFIIELVEWAIIKDREKREEE